MSSKNRYITLNDGNKMPLMGYGTFLSADSEELTKNVVHAIVECGYRHIDTATLYGNEAAIGEALKQVFEQGITREELFITTKVWKDGYKDVQGSIDGSLEKLGLEYVDLLLIHWGVADVDWETFEFLGPSVHDTWKEFEKIKEQGKAKSIGVSNVNNMLFVDLCAGAKIRPAVNQIETNPYFAQPKVVDFQRKFGVSITAYAPIGASGFTDNDVLKDPVLAEIAEKHNATVAQIALAWNIARDVVVIPKSMTEERILENFNALDITLDEEDIEKINAIDRGFRGFNPENWVAPARGWNKQPLYE